MFETDDMPILINKSVVPIKIKYLSWAPEISQGLNEMRTFIYVRRKSSTLFENSSTTSGQATEIQN